MNKESPLYIILFMIAVCIVFSLAVSAVNYATLDMLKQNEKLHRNRIIVKAFMLNAPDEKPGTYEEIIKNNIEALTLKTETGELESFKNINTGDIGFVFRGNGFWDIITGIVVISQDLEKIYHDAGQFYWGSAASFINCLDLYSSGSLPVVLPRYLVQDIDSQEDWERAELIFNAWQQKY